MGGIERTGFTTPSGTVTRASHDTMKNTIRNPRLHGGGGDNGDSVEIGLLPRDVAKELGHDNLGSVISTLQQQGLDDQVTGSDISGLAQGFTDAIRKIAGLLVANDGNNAVAGA